MRNIAQAHVQFIREFIISSSRLGVHQLFHTVFKQLPNQKQGNEEYDDETIEGLARAFASKMPEQVVFSPAEVLSFLLERKKSPLDAVSCVESWAAKAKG